MLYVIYQLKLKNFCFYVTASHGRNQILQENGNMLCIGMHLKRPYTHVSVQTTSHPIVLIALDLEFNLKQVNL